MAQAVPVADFNNDDAVELNDYAKLVWNLNKSPATFADGDLNSDGKVDFFDVVGFIGFGAPGRNQYGSGGDPVDSPPGDELSLIVRETGDGFLWGLLKAHPSERVLLQGYSIRSEDGRLTPPDASTDDVFDAAVFTSRFEVATVNSPLRRVDGLRPINTVIESPVVLSDLDFRYVTPEGIFQSFVHPGIPGDANLDGAVQFEDFLIVSDSFGQPGNWARGDFNHDGTVGFPDFLVLSTNFGQAFPQRVEPVPEPTSGLWSLILLSAAVIRAAAGR